MAHGTYRCDCAADVSGRLAHARGGSLAEGRLKWELHTEFLTLTRAVPSRDATLPASVEERTRAQVHIQQAVEGFSVIAITYYAVGLAKVCLESIELAGVDVHWAKSA